MVMRVGNGVGAGLMLDGALLHGHHVAAGEIGHVMVDDDGDDVRLRPRRLPRDRARRPASAPRLDAADDRGRPARRHRRAGSATALAPVVSALNLRELVLSGPADLLDGPLRDAATATSATASCPSSATTSTVRMSTSATTSSSSAPPSSCSPASWGSRDAVAGSHPMKRQRPGAYDDKQDSGRSTTALPLAAGAQRLRLGATTTTATTADDGPAERRRDPGLAQRHRHPAGGARLAEDDVRGGEPGLHAHDRGAAVGRPGRAAHHLALQRVRDPRRRRGRQHPGRRRSPPPAPSPTSPTSSTSSAATTCCRASSTARHGRRQDLRRALLRRLEVRLLPQGPVREGRPRGADHDGRVRRRRDRAEEGQPDAGRTSPASGSPARTGATAALHLGRRRRPRGRGRRRVAGRPSSPESLAGLETCRRSSSEASGAAKDGNEADPQVPFCANEIGMLSAPGWVRGVIERRRRPAARHEENVGVFALPGTDGEPAPVLLGGSNIAVAAKSQNQDLAKKAVELMLSDEYQTILAETGLTPAKTSLASAARRRRVRRGHDRRRPPTPSSPRPRRLGERRGRRILEDLFVGIANGGDVAELAAEADEKIDGSSSTSDRTVDRTPARPGRATRRPGRARRTSPARPAPERGGTHVHARWLRTPSTGRRQRSRRRAPLAGAPALRARCCPALLALGRGPRLPAGPPARHVPPGVRPGPAVRPAAPSGSGWRTTATLLTDPLPLDVVLRSVRVLPGQRRAHDGASASRSRC